MRNKVGKDAFITNGTLLTNLGKRVQVVSYIGYLNAGESFEYNGMVLYVSTTDHYFWIFSGAGLETAMGETSKAYAPDSWLMPIDDDEEDVKTEVKELEDTTK
jgi:hypothetical protein